MTADPADENVNESLLGDALEAIAASEPVDAHGVLGDDDAGVVADHHTADEGATGALAVLVDAQSSGKPNAASSHTESKSVDEMVGAIAACLNLLKDRGGDPISEKFLKTRMSDVRKRRKLASDPGCWALVLVVTVLLLLLPLLLSFSLSLSLSVSL